MLSRSTHVADLANVHVNPLVTGVLMMGAVARVEDEPIAHAMRTRRLLAVVFEA